MGVNQPNKRVANQAGKKGKPARKAGASIQSTTCASKPAHAKTIAHGPFKNLPLFCGAQKRAASAADQQVHALKQLHRLILLEHR